MSDVTMAKYMNGHISVFTFAVTLSAAYDQPVALSYRTTDTVVKPDEDHAATAGVLVFAPGETGKTITVRLPDNSKSEASDSTYLDLFGLSKNALLTKSHAELT
jgi:hypothetical protein